MFFRSLEYCRVRDIGRSETQVSGMSDRYGRSFFHVLDTVEFGEFLVKKYINYTAIHHF